MTDHHEVAALFTEAFGVPPAGVWSAPGRVNLIGEHTDYTGGFVMPYAIGHRAWVAARPRADGQIRAIARDRGVEQVQPDDVQRGHPADWLGYLAGAAHVADADHGWDLALASDVPIGAGLSSSAAITCATLLAINDVTEWGMDRRDLALLAQRVEHEIIGMPCGIMDQTASLLCMADHFLMLDTRSLQHVHVPWDGPEHGLVLLVTDTRAPHVLADGQYAERRRLCEEATLILGVSQLRDADIALVEAAEGRLTADQMACARYVVSENSRVLRARDLLEVGRPDEIGPLLTASHAGLRDDFRVTIPPLDVAVDAALQAGALGARMIGGGFGGSTLALIEQSRATQVQLAIDRAFAGEGFTPPQHLMTTPEGGARRDA